SIANRTAGSMWLGVDGQEGKAFDSRPAKLKGFYQFVADSQDPNEQGVVEIQILNGDKVIGSAKKELKACSGYTEFILPIQYVAISELFKVKATSLRISFTSSNRTSNIKTTNYCNKDECVSRGAMLIVDNLTFEY
ncbi:MAG: PCMD domain-containing protein, partial [Muribaculaceae bacterium]|nr:PCMD domain-containing protein [Muribaculaceae bacterium]